MEFQLLAMNDSVGLLILVVGMAVAVALIALLESKMNAPQPAASVPEERHAPAAAAKAAPAPAPRAPVVETGVPAEVVAAIAAAVACLEGGAATVRGIRRLPRPPVRAAAFGAKPALPPSPPRFCLNARKPRKSKASVCRRRPAACGGFQRVEKLDTLQRGQQPRTAAPNASISPLLKSPSTKFYGKSRTRHCVPRTQFAAKFPCRCRRRRRMSADGDAF